MSRGDRSWITAETARKEEDFRGLLGGIHLPIYKAIQSRHGRPSDPPYLYIDLHGGPGHLSHPSVGDFLGSPLIALDQLGKAGIQYESLHFESDPTAAAQLSPAVRARDSRSSATVHAGPFETGMRLWLGAQPRHQYRYGLAYSDPIRDPIPVETFNLLAAHFPRVDLLAYVAANDQYKRANGGRGNGPKLAEHIAAINKKHALIRTPYTAHQWTFILWTNWTRFPDWTKRGFHSLTSPQGREILDLVNYSEAERKAAQNTPLPFEDLPPYSSYREYLRHPRFLAVRKIVFERAAGKCERCGLRPPTEPHHLRYPPWGTFDVPENLIAICHPCHCEIHGKAA